MKATGIIRRIDDLGRIAIPKEIRRTMHLHENDPMEIFIDGDILCFQKYNAIDSYSHSISDILNDFIREYGCNEQLMKCVADLINIIKDTEKENSK